MFNRSLLLEIYRVVWGDHSSIYFNNKTWENIDRIIIKSKK